MTETLAPAHLKTQRSVLERMLLVLAAPFAVFLQHRHLIVRIARREVEQRYRGSALGLLWTLITPLLMLLVYTFVFSVVFNSKWTGEGADKSFSLLLFSGMIVFGILSEPMNRAPALMLENVSYIKKVVFPLDALAWVSLLSTLFNAFVSFLIWTAVYLFLAGIPPWTLILLPIVLLPLCLLAVGCTWLLAAFGVYLRDLRQIIPVVTTVLMFGSPVFFPRTAVPARYQLLMDLNPLTGALEMTRSVAIYGHVPSWGPWALMLVACWVIFTAGHFAFQRMRGGFADVV